ncbi:MAG: S-layer related protein (Precursor), partial [Planctomycetaceae bacterium]
YPSYFLDTTGRPKRVVNCECERTTSPNLASVLHLINGDIIQTKLNASEGRLAKFVAEKIEPRDAIRECYLATYCRPPEPQELKFALQFFDSSSSPLEGYQDILWAILNSREFLFNH